jgi:hypothetical protein
MSMRPDHRILACAGAVAGLLMASCGEAGPLASGSPTPTPVPTGSIAGKVGFPAEGIPPMTIAAISVDTGRSRTYSVHTIRNQSPYTIKGVAAGTYQVFTVPSDGFGPPPQHFLGAYTKAVPCGLDISCADHTPLPVTVSAGQAITGISVTDFYAAANSYPLVPGGDPTPIPLSSPSASYPTAIAAALYEAQRGTGARHVLQGAFDQCPPNDTCAALQQRHDGTRSAFFDTQAGSNSDLMTCGVYVYQDTAGWHPLNTACGMYPAPGKSISATFMGSGCINVRVNPGYTSKIVECLPVDTMVTIDQGPVFIQEAAASDAGNLNRLWWHLVGHGWMVHQYLTGVFNTQ